MIPWSNTQAITNGIAGLNRLYNSLDPNSNLKLFIDNHCSHLLKPLTGDTGIPMHYKNVDTLKTLPGVVTQLPPKFKTGMLRHILPTVGVYVFFTASKLIQCGSSISFISRMRSRYLESVGGKFTFGKYLITDYSWVPVKCTTNYLTLFRNKFGDIDPIAEAVLTCFMQQEIRSIEQAFSDFAAPENFKGTPVNMWHSNWQEGDDYGVSNTGKWVSWQDQDGKPVSFSSIAQAAEDLNLGQDRVRTAGKYIGQKIASTKYGDIVVSIQGVTKIKGSPDLRSGTPINEIVDTTDLIPNLYYVFDSNMDLLPIGPFSTAAELKLALGMEANYTGIATWCNYVHLLKAPSLGFSVYVYKVFVSNDVPLWLTEVTSANPVPVSLSSKQVMKDLDVSRSVILKRIHDDSLYMKDNKAYRIECQDPLDTIKLKAQHVARVAKSRAIRLAK